MVLTVSFVLSPVIGLFVTVAGAMRKHCRQLNISVEMSGPHDFAVRLARDRLSRQSVHRIPHPTFVTIAKRPSYRARDGRENALDLPVVTSERACGKLTRRANQSCKRKTCQVPIAIPGRCVSIEPGIHSAA